MEGFAIRVGELINKTQAIAGLEISLILLTISLIGLYIINQPPSKEQLIEEAKRRYKITFCKIAINYIIAKKIIEKEEK